MVSSGPLSSGAIGIALIGMAKDEYGRIMRASCGLAALLSRAPEDLIGTRLCQHLDPRDHSESHGAFLRLMARPEDLYEGDLRFVTADGRVVAVRAVASIVAARHGPAILLRVLSGSGASSP